ncbi:formin-like protein [Gracilaria domingensis]|nr:formin-like protein [Gracilaria domingensis]
MLAHSPCPSCSTRERSKRSSCSVQGRLALGSDTHKAGAARAPVESSLHEFRCSADEFVVGAAFGIAYASGGFGTVGSGDTGKFERVDHAAKVAEEGWSQELSTTMRLSAAEEAEEAEAMGMRKGWKRCEAVVGCDATSVTKTVARKRKTHDVTVRAEVVSTEEEDTRDSAQTSCDDGMVFQQVVAAEAGVRKTKREGACRKMLWEAWWYCLHAGIFA